MFGPARVFGTRGTRGRGWRDRRCAERACFSRERAKSRRRPRPLRHRRPWYVLPRDVLVRRRICCDPSVHGDSEGGRCFRAVRVVNCNQLLEDILLAPPKSVAACDIIGLGVSWLWPAHSNLVPPSFLGAGCTKDRHRGGGVLQKVMPSHFLLAKI